MGNESQERMGLVISEKDVEKVNRIAERERAPFYVVGETTGDMRLTFVMPPNPLKGEQQGMQTAYPSLYSRLKELSVRNRHNQLRRRISLGTLKGKNLEILNSGDNILLVIV